MTHLQLQRQDSGERVLLAYYSGNYVSLVPGESKTITIEAATADMKAATSLVVVDGWNVAVTPATSAGVAIELNENAQLNHWPVRGLPFYSGVSQ